MIHIPMLRTRRLTVQLRELSMGEAIALAACPPEANEAATSRLLAATIERAEGGTPDPEDWTVQERLMAVTHYLAATLDDGPDFALDPEGEARYSHYLLGEQDYPGERTPGGTLDGSVWQVRQLTGRLAGAIERTDGELEGVTGRAHWMVGRLAAQMIANDDPWPTGGDLDEILLERMRRLMARPESAFIQLQVAWLDGCRRLQHLFDLDFDAQGALVYPRADLEGATTRSPARFPVHAGLSPVALGLGRALAADRP